MSLNKKEFNQIFGERLRFFRERLDIKQIDLAYNIGYSSTATISQIETGKRGMGKSKIKKAADFLGVHPAILMSEKEFDPEMLDMISNFIRMLERDEPKDHHYHTIKSILEIIPE